MEITVADMPDLIRDRFRDLVKGGLGKFGYELRRRSGVSVVDDSQEFPPDFDDEAIQIMKSASGLTMTSPERQIALIQAIRYITEASIPGDIVECGVWRGGSMKIAAETLLKLGSTNRRLFLFDTFEGMPAPTTEDVDFNGVSELESRKEMGGQAIARAPLYGVRQVMESTGYDKNLIHYIKGMVEDTLSDQAPEKAALIRLDTDYYSSTKHELNLLYPRVSPGGVVILDDYGHFEGAKLAVDEYLAENNIHVLMSRTDYAGRTFVKPFGKS